jgi:hypothetical protein
MNMLPERGFVGIRGRRRRPRVRHERRIANFRAPTATLTRHRSRAHDGRRDLREQSDAKQQLGETAA